MSALTLANKGVLAGSSVLSNALNKLSISDDGVVQQTRLGDGEKYVLVRKSDIVADQTLPDVKGSVHSPGGAVPTKDIRDVMVSTITPGLIREMRESKGSYSLKKPLKTKLFYWSGGLSGSTNTTYSTVTGLSPVTAADYTSFSALYDVVRCTGLTIHWLTGVSGSCPSQPSFYGAAFDPANSNAYGNLPDTWNAKYSFGPMGLQTAAATGSSAAMPVGPQDMVNKGVHRLDIKLPKGAVLAANSGGSFPGPAGSQWVGTNLSSSNYLVGYFKPLVPALGSGSVFCHSFAVSFDLEFAFRS